MSLHTSRLVLLTGFLALTACSSTTPSAEVPVATTPTQTTPKLGMVEIEFSGIGSQLQATAVRPISTQALTDQPCVVVGSVLGKTTADFGGKRYMQATFPVTNNCTTDLKNLTYVAARRLGTNATVGDSAITSMKTFGGTDAAVDLATQILPTQPMYGSGKRLNVDQTIANLQVFNDTANGELDGLQTQVDANRTQYDLLPYGFVATSAGSRTIPVGGTGEVTFALSVPIQPSAAQDVFSFRLLASAATNSVTSVTQGLEEQDAAGKAAVEVRAAALPGAEIRTLLGPTMTTAAAAGGGLPVCRVRTAGPRSAPTATLVDAQAVFSMNNPSVPSIIGGPQRVPYGTLTVNGNRYPVKLNSLKSLTPATLSTTNDLVHPVVTFPLRRSSGLVQGTNDTCGQQFARATVSISPYTSVASYDQHNIAVKTDGTVVIWGDIYSTAVPAGLSDVVAVTTGYDHFVALKSDGTVVAWGRNNGSHQLDVPDQLSKVIAVAAGDGFTVALKLDGTVVAWGLTPRGQPAGLSDVVAISAHDQHVVALKSDGTVVTWGNTDVTTAGLTGVIAISTALTHTLALKSDGTVLALGGPAVPAGLREVVAVATGFSHSVALKSDGSTVAWGGGFGQSTVFRTSAVAIAAGENHILMQEGSSVSGPGGSEAAMNMPNVMVP